MKALIPAAGLGSRFLPVTRVIPKEMLPIGAKPALELIVEEAKAAGAEEIVIVISPGKELIREYFKDDPSISFE
jgi:UTP--glucose-1-phosphate uridylyltransferase